jgi:hypothetical protein
VNANIQIPDEVQHILDERTKIWHEMDAAVGRADQLNQVAQAIGGMTGQVEEVPAPLTDGDDPRQEIERVLSVVAGHQKDLGAVEKELSATREEIQRIKSHAQTMTMLLIGGGVVVIIVIFLVLSNAL